MANALQERGVFWWFQEAHGLTASLESAIPGELTINEEGHIELRLEGSLWFENPEVSFHWDESRWLPYEKRIAGRLGEYGGTYVVLIDLVRTDFSLADDKPGRQSYEAVLCFTNDTPFPPDFDPETFSAVRIELTDLEEWLQLDSIEIGYEHRDGHRTEVAVSYTNHEFVYETPVAKVTVENLILGVPSLRLSDRPLSKIDIHQTNWLIYAPVKQNTLAELQTAFLRIEEVISLLLGRHFRLDWPTFVAGQTGSMKPGTNSIPFEGPRARSCRGPFSSGQRLLLCTIASSSYAGRNGKRT